MRSRASSDLLRRVTDLLCDAATCDVGDAALGVVTNLDGIELHLRPLAAGEHVVDALLGFDAPPEWAMVGVIAHGRAHRLHPQPAEPVGREPIVIVHLQGRDGASCSAVGPPGGVVQRSTDPGEGRVVDVCRRSLSLPTAAAVGTPLRWWAARWLDALCGEAGLELVANEAELVARFPGGAPFGAEHSFGELLQHGHLLATSCPWSALHQAAAAGTVSVPGIPAELAPWMDAGMFQRWAIEDAGRVDLLAAEVALRLPRPMARRLEWLLRRWEVLP